LFVRTAILIDGSFFLRRHKIICGDADAKTVVKNLFTWCLKHLEDPNEGRRKLYRIFFYDCPPLEKKAHNPVTKRAVDFSKTPQAAFRHAVHQELSNQRKVALRLGRLSDHALWRIRERATADLLAGRLSPAQLSEHDVEYETRQKGVDMRIGLDIASLAFKEQVDQIVLVAGDADFVPAAKLARREGIDFILDPMWAPTPRDLSVHIDGLRSTCPRPPYPSR
jgi:uncharacterized LabA/DUF88 family protein